MPKIDFSNMEELYNELTEQYAQGLITKDDIINQLSSIFWNALTKLNESLD